MMRWVVLIVGAATLVAVGCNTIYVMTGTGHKVEDNNSVERKVDIDRSKEQAK